MKHDSWGVHSMQIPHHAASKKSGTRALSGTVTGCSYHAFAPTTCWTSTNTDTFIVFRTVYAIGNMCFFQTSVSEVKTATVHRGADTCRDCMMGTVSQCWAASCIAGSVILQITPGKYELLGKVGPDSPTLLWATQRPIAPFWNRTRSCGTCPTCCRKPWWYLTQWGDPALALTQVQPCSVRIQAKAARPCGSMGAILR